MPSVADVNLGGTLGHTFHSFTLFWFPVIIYVFGFLRTGLLMSVTSPQEAFDTMAAQKGREGRRKSDPKIQLILERRQSETWADELRHVEPSPAGEARCMGWSWVGWEGFEAVNSCCRWWWNWWLIIDVQWWSWLMVDVMIDGWCNDWWSIDVMIDGEVNHFIYGQLVVKIVDARSLAKYHWTLSTIHKPGRSDGTVWQTIGG